MNRIGLFSVVLILLFGIVKTSRADIPQIDALDITSAAVSCGNDCLEYQIRGVCFWVRCNLGGCSFRESPKVSHYLPVLLVNTYSNQSPVQEVDGINPVEMGSLVPNQKAGEHDTYLDYKHAEIFSNPAIVTFNALADTTDGFFCRSAIRLPFIPYFLSGIDPEWSNPSAENLFPQAISGLPKFTTRIPLGYWASVFPRCGWGSHPFDAINGAVAAHRAAAITTSAAAPHVYTRPSTRCTNRCWQPRPIVQGSLSNHKFQMVYPVEESRPMVMGGNPDWARRKNRNESYAWNLWRPYTCCRDRGDFIDSIDW